MKTAQKMVTVAGVFVAIGLAVVSVGIAFGPTSAMSDDDFDRSRCLSDCKDAYMGPWFSNPGGEDWETHRRSRGSYEGRLQLYYRCVMECEKKFWDKFDKDSENAPD